MTDAGYNANQIHPDWFDVVRPTKLPSIEGEYGSDGNAYFQCTANPVRREKLSSHFAGRTENNIRV